MPRQGSLLQAEPSEMIKRPQLTPKHRQKHPAPSNPARTSKLDMEAELCPLDDRRSAPEVSLKLAVVRFTTITAYCHLLSTRGEPTVWICIKTVPCFDNHPARPRRPRYRRRLPFGPVQGIWGFKAVAIVPEAGSIHPLRKDRP